MLAIPKETMNKITKNYTEKERRESKWFTTKNSTKYKRMQT